MRLTVFGFPSPSEYIISRNTLICKYIIFISIYSFVYPNSIIIIILYNWYTLRSEP